MNFKSTTGMFALLLAMLWLFGLMLAYKHNPPDQTRLVFSMAADADLVIDEVAIKRVGPDKKTQEIDLSMADEIWKMRQPGTKSTIRVDGRKVENIIKQVREAKKNDNVSVTDDPQAYGLDQPAVTVVLKGKLKGETEKRTWKVFLGKESPDQLFYYASSSDRPNKVLAVSKFSLNGLDFADANHLRAVGIFEFQEGAVRAIAFRDGKNVFDVARGEDGMWRFLTPALGFADYEGPAPAKEPKDPDEPKEPKKLGRLEGDIGIKGLVALLSVMRVDSADDFVPQGDTSPANFGVEDGKEHLRIEVTLAAEKDKEPPKRTLLIGLPFKDKDKNQVFARLQGDEGIFKLNAKLLEPIKQALNDPRKYRSLDMAFFDAKKADYIAAKQGKDEFKFWQTDDGKGWKVQSGTAKPAKASSKAVEALLEGLLGKREIKSFFDRPEAEAKKLDAELGIDTPSFDVTVYLDSLEKSGKKDEEPDDKDKEAKKDDKKEAKKDEAPALKKDAKPAVKLTFGKTEKEEVYVKRVLPDGSTSWFAVPKTILEKIAPAEGSLAYLDLALPAHSPGDVVRFELARGSDKIDLERGKGDDDWRWYFKGGKDGAARSQADPGKAKTLVDTIASLHAKKWIKKFEASDLDTFGLKSPTLTAVLYVKKDRVLPAGAASSLGAMAFPGLVRAFMAEAALLANKEADPGDPVTLQIGKETTEAKDKPAYYAKHSGADLIFLVPESIVKLLRDTDVKDRSGILRTQAFLGLGLAGPVAAEPQTAWLLASPLATGHIQSFDPAKVQKLKVSVRTKEELRSFTFAYVEKAKEWVDQSGLAEFNLDGDKVKQTIDWLKDLNTERFASLSDGPKPEHKLGPKEYNLILEVTLEGGRTITLTMGGNFERVGYFAHSTAWPEVVFFVPASKVDPLLRGIGYFAKERAVAGP